MVEFSPRFDSRAKWRNSTRFSPLTLFIFISFAWYLLLVGWSAYFRWPPANLFFIFFFFFFAQTNEKITNLIGSFSHQVLKLQRNIYKISFPIWMDQTALGSYSAVHFFQWQMHRVHVSFSFVFKNPLKNIWSLSITVQCWTLFGQWNLENVLVLFFFKLFSLEVF